MLEFPRTLSPHAGRGRDPRSGRVRGNRSPASKLDVPVFTTARGMPNREDHDLLRSLVDHVIDEIAIFGRHEFADAFDILGTTDRRKKRQVLKRAQYCILSPRAPRTDYAYADTQQF